MDLAQKLADILDEANVLDRNRTSFSTDRVRALVSEVQTEAKEYLTFISEAAATIRCGRPRTWLRAQFPEWQRQGHARFNASGKREYRQVIIPLDHDSAAVQSDAVATAREVAGQ
jgi:hypothetical protein